MNTLEVVIPLDKKKSQSILESVGLEAKQEEYERSQVNIKYDDKLIIQINANDLTALRAAVNTHLRWVDTAIKLLDK